MPIVYFIPSLLSIAISGLDPFFPFEPPGPQTLMHGLRRFHDIGLGFMLRAEKPVDAIVINKLMGQEQS